METIIANVNFIHHGATKGVTGSCHELKIGRHSLLIDCGLFQGAEVTDGQTLEAQAIDFAIEHVQALLVTHCHIDHVGRIPYLLAAGFKGPIFATEATAQLLPLVLEDALKVGVTRDKRLIEQFLKLLKKQVIALPYRHWHQLDRFDNTVKIKFQPAGHILGSAYIEIDVGSSSGKSQRIVFGGDLGAPYTPLLPSPRSPYCADILVIESTYGDKLHQGRKERIANLERILSSAIADNGIVLVPAFSIGRTQELLYELEAIQHRLSKRIHRGALANIEVIVDSPMAAKFTEQYRQLKSLWNKEAKRKVNQGRHPLSFENLYTIDSHQQHLDCIDYLAKRSKPAIVIAASGMCSGGRIVNYLKRFISDSTTDLLFVGYQARGTLGRNIQRYGPRGGYVFIDGQRFDVRAKVHTISGYSAHADQKDLVNFVKRMRRKPKQIRIVHGDDEAKAALAECYRDLIPGIDVVVP